jgi:predicted DNA-binding protein
MKKNSGSTKDEFLRLRIDKEEKRRLDLLSKLTRRQKSDLVRESLFELYKNKYPDCLIS